MSDSEKIKNAKEIKRKKQMAELYQAYGQFVVEFEHVYEAIRTCIIFILYDHGLREQKYSRILIAHESFNQLLEKLRALVYLGFEGDPDSYQHLDDLFKHTSNLIKKRNTIIHSTWYIGWGNEYTEDFDVANGTKFRIPKKGNDVITTKYTAGDIDAITNKLKLATNLYYRLHSCVSRGYPVSKNITKTDIAKLA